MNKIKENILSISHNFKKSLKTSQNEKPFSRRTKVVNAHSGGVNCSILESGLTPKYGTYYFCECDDERRNPICKECWISCHSNENQPNDKQKIHGYINSLDCYAVCICGFKFHQGLKQIKSIKNFNESTCFFGEWGKYKVYPYVYINDQKRYCIFCKNFCVTSQDEFKKTELSLENIKQFTCCCLEHSTFAGTLRKLRMVVQRNNNINFDMEGLTLNHFVNLLQIGETNVKNIFITFKKKIKETVDSLNNSLENVVKNSTTIKTDLKKENCVFDDHKYINELHIISKTLSTFCENTKNVYTISNKKISPSYNNYNYISADKALEKQFNIKNKQKENFNDYDDDNKVYYINCKAINYFNSQIDSKYLKDADIDTYKLELIDKCDYIEIMKKKFDSKSKNIWLLKNYLTRIFYTFEFQKYFSYLPNYKINDLLLLSPIQRITMFANKDYLKVNELINSLKLPSQKTLFNNLLDLLNINTQMMENIYEYYSITNYLLKMILQIVKWSSIAPDTVKIYCRICNSIITNFKLINESEKMDLRTQRPKFKILSTMMKIALFIAYKYNDEIYAVQLKKTQKNISFFHMYSYICKLIVNLNINCLSYIKYLMPEGELEERSESFKKRRKSTNPNEINLNFTLEYPFHRCFKNTVKCCMEINSLIFDIPDCYSMGIKRCINQDFGVEYDNLLSIDAQNMPSAFVRACRDFHIKIEELFNNVFQNYVNPINYLNTEFKSIMDKILDLCDIQYNQEDLCKKSVACYDEDKELISTLNENFSNKNNKNKLKMNLSFLIQAIFKYIQVAFYIEKNTLKSEGKKESKYDLRNKFLNKIKNNDIIFNTVNRDYFTVDPNIFIRIVSISSYFFIESVNNAILFFTSDIMASVELLNENQLITMLNLVKTILKIIYKNCREISVNTSICHLLKIATVKASENLDILDPILDIIQMMFHIGFLNEINTRKKLKTIIINIYKNLEAKDISLKNLLIKEQSENDNKKLEKILYIINQLFEGEQIIGSHYISKSILTKKEIREILLNKQIHLGLRTQILYFYRMLYIDTVVQKGKGSLYTSLLIGKPFTEKCKEVLYLNMNDSNYHRFYEKILIVDPVNQEREYLTKDAEILLNELKNFSSNIDQYKNDNTAVKDYISYGILKTLQVYTTKFSSLVYGCSGYDYINYYQILYYFLIFIRDYILTNLERLLVNEEEQNIFCDELSTWGRAVEPIVNQDFIKKLIENENYCKEGFTEELNKDIKNLEKKTLEIFNFENMYRTLKKYTDDIYKSPTIEGFKDYFEKSNRFYTEEKEENMRKIIKGTYNSDEKVLKNFNIFILYVNGKTYLEKSSFLELLQEDNKHFNSKNIILFINNLLLFIIPSSFVSNFSCYSENTMWHLFRLLEFATSQTQSAFYEIQYKHIFQNMLNNFTLHLTNVICYEINPCSFIIRHEYYLTIMIIKIFKYFCEEHNKTYQEVFFNYENGIKCCYDNKEYLNYEPRKNSYLNKFRELNSIDEKSQNKFDFKPNNFNKKTSMSPMKKYKSCENFVLEKKLPKGDNQIMETEDDNLVPPSCGEQSQNQTASTFEYMLSILSKTILLARWATETNEEKYNTYYYDLYFVILEFLIETIQGTKRDNLKTLCPSKNYKEKEKTNLFNQFLIEIYPLVTQNGCEGDQAYQLRKDMMDFLMAFLEECETPKESIESISSSIPPMTILNCITFAMLDLYKKSTEDYVDNCNSIKSSNKSNKTSEKLDDVFRINSADSKGKRPSVNVTKMIFSHKVKKYFEREYFTNEDFPEEIRFQLANRMYQFFKMYSLDSEYKNEQVCEFYQKINAISEKEAIASLKMFEKAKKQPESKKSSDSLSDREFMSKYMCVKFFESITRTVIVQNVNSEKLVSIIFTLNPIVPLLSNLSKTEFINNVDRDDRYTKLSRLVEACDYFYEEIMLKKNQFKSNKFIKAINEINFYALEITSFLITLAINILLICVVSGTGDSMFGNVRYLKVINALALSNLIFNVIAVIIWMFSKYSLFYLAESSKLKKKKKEEKLEKSEECPFDEDEEIQLSILDQYYLFYEVVIAKGKLFGFFWNIIFSAAGYFSNIQMLYIIQIFALVNLSVTLRNLIRSITFKAKQLFAVLLLTIIFNHVFGAIAFFNFSKDFIRATDYRTKHTYPEEFKFLYDVIGGPNNEESHMENECGSLLYCVTTHFDYGMRFDGGIADRMSHASYTQTKGYYLARFFYEEFYFIILVILMLNMIFGIIIEAFSELRAHEASIETDKKEVCFICSVNKETCEKRGKKIVDHMNNVHNIWTYVEYILGLRFVDIQETNAINSLVMLGIENKELSWFPVDPEANNE